MILRKIFVVLLVLIVVGSIFGLFYYSGETEVMEDRVAFLNFQGPIQEGLAGFGTGVITPDRVVKSLNNLKNINGIEAVVLRIDSPGGAIGASQEIYNIISNYEMPVVISMGDMAASGGYYIAAAADRIVAHPGTMTGSIGVITTFYDPEGLLENIGIERETVMSGEHKDMFSRTLTEEEREKMQTLSDEAYNQFINHIAEGRNLEVDDILPYATGEIFLGSQALEYNLVDSLGGRSEALRIAGELSGIEDPEYYYPSEPGIFQRMSELALKIPQILQGQKNPELILLERLENGLKPALKYQVPGF
ncbi:MAG: signal peptide peptidase SppA [Halarsenatibacteraceae bacterium]